MAAQLKPYEQEWLDEYQEALRQKYAGVVERVFTFDRADGSIPIPEYTVNVVVILKTGDRRTVKDIKRLGYVLSGLSEVIPLIWVYSNAEWQHKIANNKVPVLRMFSEEMFSEE